MPIVDRQKEREIVIQGRQQGLSDDQIRQQVLEFRSQASTPTETGQTQEKTGFFADIGQGVKSLGQQLQKRVENVKEEAQASRERTSGYDPALAFRSAGQVAGAIGDIAGQALFTGVKAIAPADLEKAVVDTGAKVLQTPAGQAGLRAVSQGIEKYEGWKSKNPELAKDLEAAVNIASLLPIERGISAGAKGLTRGAKATARATEEAVETTARATRGGLKGLTQATRDVVPTRQQLVSQQVTNALNLTKGDTANLLNTTGNELGEFLARQNLIRNTKDQTVKAVGDFFTDNYKAVREAIDSVPNTYKTVDVPRYEDSLQAIKKVIADVKGLEADNAIVDDLLKKESVQLKDIQQVKELLDDHYRLYNVTGDPAAGVQKEGIRKLRQEIRSFIEKEVDDATGVDVRTLNNNVQTARAITDAVQKRSTTGLTKGNVSLSDLGTLGGFSFIGGPAAGIAATFVKKIIESPAIRLRFAKWLSKLSNEEKIAARNALMRGELPEGMPESIIKTSGLTNLAKKD